MTFRQALGAIAMFVIGVAIAYAFTIAFAPLLLEVARSQFTQKL
jgi:hypothetical protein